MLTVYVAPDSKKPRGDIFEGTRVEVVGTPEFKVPTPIPLLLLVPSSADTSS